MTARLGGRELSRRRHGGEQGCAKRLDWRRANGQLKDMICRIAMLRMRRDGLIRLPPPRRRRYNGALHRRRIPQAEPELPIITRVDAMPDLQVRPLADQREAQLWREYSAATRRRGPPGSGRACLRRYQPIPRFRPLALHPLEIRQARALGELVDHPRRYQRRRIAGDRKCQLALPRSRHLTRRPPVTDQLRFVLYGPAVFCRAPGRLVLATVAIKRLADCLLQV